MQTIWIKWVCCQPAGKMFHSIIEPLAVDQRLSSYDDTQQMFCTYLSPWCYLSIYSDFVVFQSRTKCKTLNILNGRIRKTYAYFKLMSHNEAHIFNYGIIRMPNESIKRNRHRTCFHARAIFISYAQIMVFESRLL